jgi:hypothetical protein
MENDMKTRKISCRFAAAAVLTLLHVTAFAEDRAIVVGVQKYVNLPKYAALSGCANDAASMKTALEAHGFKVTSLIDEQGTRESIFAAISGAATNSKPSDRFVFYFAGHGTDAPRPAILPYDSQEQGNHITREELYAAVSAVKSKSRTIILDSCFSGAMSKAIDATSRPRYFRPAGSKSITPASGQDTEPVTVTSGTICYFNAAAGNEKALEVKLPDGQYHGVFTWCLASELKDNAGKNAVWSSIQKAVSGQVGEKLGASFQQHPMLSPAFVDTSLFDGRNASAIPEPDNKLVQSTVWDDYHSSRADPDRIALSVDPDSTDVKVGQQFSFKVTVGMTGYLVILNRDASNKVAVLWPESRSVDKAAVKAGQKLFIPDDANNAFHAGAAGIEHVKAILFASREKAEAVLKAFPAADGVTFTGLKLLQQAPAKKSPFFTSELTFTVSEK